MMLETLIWIFNFQQEQSIQQKHGSAQNLKLTGPLGFFINAYLHFKDQVNVSANF